jgi:hypothetical protein
MNGRRAKELRKLIYGNSKKKTTYLAFPHKKKIMAVVEGKKKEIEVTRWTIKCGGLRERYQQAKKELYNAIKYINMHPNLKKRPV